MYCHRNSLTLRKVSAADLPHLLALKSESWFGTHMVSILNELDEQRWFERISADSDSLVMIATQDCGGPHPRLVGVYKALGIDWVNRSYDFSYDVFREERGRGLGHRVVEAGVDFGFEILNMERVTAEVLENNLASMKCLTRVGFQVEARKRQAVWRCGERLDSLVYGLLRDEWLASDRVRDYGGVCNFSYRPKDDQK